MSSTVHVFGAAGFAGAQLAALIDAHPHFALGQITARADAGRPLREVAPEYPVDQELVAPDPGGTSAGDFAAVCYPHAEAAELVGELVDRGLRVVDVSADHRLPDLEVYERHYGVEHPRPDLVAEAVYGMPEINRDGIRSARVVANPGCFPVASILALLPLKDRLLDAIVDAKTGVSGAGKTPTPTVHFSQVAENLAPYKALAHRHAPEMAQALGVHVAFVPHLVPLDRGLEATCYARVDGPVPSAEELLSIYQDRYADHPFVTVRDTPPDMKGVQRTNEAQVAVLPDPDGGRVVGFGVIDNLGKGAAGQAVQNLNLMADRPETEGLR